MAEHDELLMESFLLGRLTPDEREAVLDRLAVDEAFYESMQAIEEELVVRWLKQELPEPDRALFDGNYRSLPGNRVKIEETRALLAAAAEWPHVRQAVASSRSAVGVSPPAWTATLFPNWRLAAVATAAFLVIASAGVWRLTRSSAGPAVVAFTLTAAGTRASGAGETMARIYIPAGAKEVRLVTSLDGASRDGKHDAVLDALDENRTVMPLGVNVSGEGESATATVAVAAADLTEGDYVLTVRLVAGGSPQPVAYRGLRVTRGK